LISGFPVRTWAVRRCDLRREPNEQKTPEFQALGPHNPPLI
jgi:hypothetical protein